MTMPLERLTRIEAVTAHHERAIIRAREDVMKMQETVQRLERIVERMHGAAWTLAILWTIATTLLGAIWLRH